ncbi:hypothetical protein GE061_003708 [Apolygus lucorum]|uniref:Uncharacterized protein n=1 Tax=Apolygus lucorum TaxID=248454 RepID=A0A8S9X2B8_APOLU|nr:hypothetical protein GE061_003708 [Apolygus lucorum]
MEIFKNNTSIPQMTDPQFKELVREIVSRSKIGEDLLKKEIELRMKQSKECHAKTIEMMELKRKTLEVELYRQRAAASAEKRKHRVVSDDQKGDEPRKHCSRDKVSARNPSAEKTTSKKTPSGFKKWWTTMFGRKKDTKEVSGRVTEEVTNQSPEKQPTGSDCTEHDGVLGNAGLSEINLHRENSFKDNRTTKWLIEELTSESYHADFEVNVHDEDSNISGYAAEGIQAGDASRKQKAFGAAPIPKTPK